MGYFEEGKHVHALILPIILWQNYLKMRNLLVFFASLGTQQECGREGTEW